MTQRIQGYKIVGRFTVEGTCGHVTTLKYAKAHDGLCKQCAEGCDGCDQLEQDHDANSAHGSPYRHASRAEQHARYIDCGPAAWDDR
jgi:hypothetical protein